MTDNEPEERDLRTASFEEFVEFLFAREVIPSPRYGSDDPEPWYYGAGALTEPLRLLLFYTRLFAEPAFLRDRFSDPQIEQGFSVILSPLCPVWSVRDILEDTDLPFRLRTNCVRAMVSLFEKLFGTLPSGFAVYMWWDILAYPWFADTRSRLAGGEDESMQDVMFETLGRILDLPQAQSQDSALHGLGHLCHPGTEALIDRYLEANPGIDPRLREFAERARRFDVL